MVDSETGKEKRTKVSIWRLATGAYAVVLGNLGTFAALALVPLVLYFLLSVALVSLSDGSVLDPAQAGPGNIWWWLWVFPLTLVLSVFVVSWHRFVLLGRRDSASLAQFQLGPREVRFFLYVALLSLPTYLISALSTEMVGNPDATPTRILLTFVIYVASVFLWLRFSFILPATAVDAEGGLGTAWHATWGVSWRMLWAIVLVVIPWIVIVGGIVLAVGLEDYYRIVVGGESYYLFAIVQSVLGFLSYAVMISVLSLAFQRHTGWTPDADAAPSIYAA